MNKMNKPLHKRFGLVLLLLAVMLLGACTIEQPSVLKTKTETAAEQTTSNVARVPWDYRIVANEVGDLIGSDMTVLPDNEMIPNDGNYATGDKIWTLQYMDAEMTTDDNQRNDIRLSGWTTIKSYKTEKAANDDLAKLKVQVTTDIDVVGVYKTKYKDQTRNFAVLELPSGNRIKQPIDDARYKALEKAKTASVKLEEVHDFAEYDLAYAKFRGWGN